MNRDASGNAAVVNATAIRFKERNPIAKRKSPAHLSACGALPEFQTSEFRFQIFELPSSTF
jgi:hypothetical protein